MHIFTPHHTNNQRAKLLHPTGLLILLFMIIGIQVILRSTAHYLPQVLGYAAQIPSSEIIRLTNIERQQRGLSELKFDEKLSQAAEKKAVDMFSKDYWAHVSPVGTQPWFFITDAGYSYRYAGENLARDFTDPNSVVQAWLASPSHRENVLNNRYQDIGVAVVDGKLGGRETTLVVQMFGTKLSAQTQPRLTDATSINVKAAEPLPTTRPKPISLGASTNLQVSPFDITKYFALFVLSLLLVVLIIDIFVVNRKNLVRWTSKSLAHLIFVVVIITAAALIVRGQII